MCVCVATQEPDKEARMLLSFCDENILTGCSQRRQVRPETLAPLSVPPPPPFSPLPPPTTLPPPSRFPQTADSGVCETSLPSRKGGRKEENRRLLTNSTPPPTPALSFIPPVNRVVGQPRRRINELSWSLKSRIELLTCN